MNEFFWKPHEPFGIQTWQSRGLLYLMFQGNVLEFGFFGNRRTRKKLMESWAKKHEVEKMPEYYCFTVDLRVKYSL